MSFWKAVGKLVETAIDKAPDAMRAIQAEAQKKQAEMYKNTERTLKEHERKVNHASNSNRMSDPNFARKVQEEKEKIERAKLKLYGGNVDSTVVQVKNGEVTIKGRTVSEWNSRWQDLGRLSSLNIDDLSRYNKEIGLYKARIGGEVVYIGRAIEHENGGFRKRLRDYVRESDSARTHGSGQKMNQNADSIQLSILVVGSSAEDVEAVRALERAMINLYKPNWNVQHNR